MILWQVIKKECRLIFIEERKQIWLLLGLPILYTLFLGMVYMGNIVKDMPTVVYDQDQSQVSRALIQAFADSERYNIIAQVTSQEDLDSYMRENEAQVALIIPQNFNRDIKLGRSSQVLAEVNGTNLMFANSVIATAQEIVQTFAAVAGRQLLEAAGELPEQALNKAVPIQFGMRILNNPTFGYGNFMLAGLGANGIQIGLVLAAATTLVREYRRLNVWQEVSTVSLVIGKLLPYWFLGMVAYIGYVAIAVFVFGLPCRGDIGSLLLLGSAFTLAVTLIGGLFSAVAPNEVYAVQLPMIYIMPAFLLSGYIWPKLAMNDAILAFNAILPLNYMADNLRDLLLSGYAPLLQRDVSILLIASFVLFGTIIFVFFLRRRSFKQQTVTKSVIGSGTGALE